MLILNNEQIEKIINIKEAIQAMETAFRELGEGTAQLIPRHAIILPKSAQLGADYYFYSMGAAIKSFKTAALRIDSRTRTVRKEAAMMRDELPGDYVGLVLLFDIENNLIKAILQDHYLSPIRMAATSALVTKYLARKNIAVMGLFGTGGQARAHAEAMSEVRSIRLIKVYSPNFVHRETFAREMTYKLGLEVQAMSGSREVVTGSDIVVAATSSNEPVFCGEWLEPGTHVVTARGSEVGMKQWETDKNTACRADIIVLNSVAPVKEGHLGLLPLLDQDFLHWRNLFEVTDLVLGRCQGRSNNQQITVHYNNVGLGIQFAAIGAIIYENAKEHGVGTEIPNELFITRQ